MCTSDREPLPLVRCPGCGSRLIYPTHSTALPQATVIERRCPDCELVDRVIASTAAVAAWARRQEAVRESLIALAEALADGAAFEIDR
jgi:ribosomal protein S27E